MLSSCNSIGSLCQSVALRNQTLPQEIQTDQKWKSWFNFMRQEIKPVLRRVHDFEYN